MRAWIASFWDAFRGSFWFLPAIITSVVFVIALVMPLVDESLIEVVPQWLKTTGPTARLVLSSLAGAMITVAGTVFSVTVVTLSLTSSQFGSRLLRTFMRDVVTHVALGSFVATSLYCLLILRGVALAEKQLFIPHLSVALGVVMAVISLGLLIFYIHHTAVSVQAWHVVQAVAHDLDATIDRLYPEGMGEPEPAERSHREIEQQFGYDSENVASVPSRADGYLQAIDSEGITAFAANHDVVIHLRCHPGDFLVAGFALAELWPAENADDDAMGRLQNLFVLGSRRTPRQDVMCAIDELVEVAVRALSPGINDPYTAIACIDRLGATLSRLAERPRLSAYRYDGEEKLRVIASTVMFPDVLRWAFGPIRQYSEGRTLVAIRILSALGHIAARTTRSEDREAIVQQASLVLESCKQHADQQEDLREIQAGYDRLVAAVDSRDEAEKLLRTIDGRPVKREG